MKNLTINKGDKTNLTFKGGKCVVTTDGQSYASWGNMIDVLDK